MAIYKDFACIDNLLDNDFKSAGILLVMLVNSQNYRTVWISDNKLHLINQLLLPHKFEIFISNSHKETANAIKTMVVRGAGAIGATGAYGVAQAALEADKNNFNEYIESAITTLKNTRPTAQNLFVGIDFIYNAIKNIDNINEENRENILDQNGEDQEGK